MAAPSRSEGRNGLLAGISAFVLWGLYPFYFKALDGIDPIEIIAHRIIWSLPILAATLPFAGRWREIRLALADRRTLLGLLATTTLIMINWFTYVLAVVGGHVLDTSLGYFLCPLASVALGVVVLKERLSPWQTIAIGVAVLAVANLIFQMGTVPGVALILASSFSVYGLLRKKLKIGPLSGLFVECVLSMPVAMGVLAWQAAHGSLGFGHVSRGIDLLLILGGIATIGPLLLFNIGAKRLNYTTVGLIQYIAPSMLFLESVLLFGEPLEFWRLVTFAAIWLALAIYTADGIRRSRRPLLA
jgi:chloramphenicol-sensitive protein RarD